MYNLNFKEKDEVRLAELDFCRTTYNDWALNEQRVNDARFLWIVVNYYSEKWKISRDRCQGSV